MLCKSRKKHLHALISLLLINLHQYVSEAKPIDTSDAETQITFGRSNLCLICSEGQYINITYARYGLFLDTPECPETMFKDILCYRNVTSKVAAMCNGRRECLVPVDNQEFEDPCPENIKKHAQVYFRCSGDKLREKRSMKIKKKKKKPHPRKM